MLRLDIVTHKNTCCSIVLVFVNIQNERLVCQLMQKIIACQGSKKAGFAFTAMAGPKMPFALVMMEKG